MRTGVTIVQTVVPDYRRPLFDALSEASNARVTVLAGDRFFEASVTTSDRVRQRPWFAPVKNFFLAETLLWQRGVVRRAVQSEACVLELNPRTLSSCAVLALRRLLRRQTTVWGHATSRDGRRRPARTLLFRAADRLLCYTDEDRASLPPWAQRKALVAPNALYSRAQLARAASPGRPSHARTDFLYVGRLSADKEVMLVIEALRLLRDKATFDGRVVFVGTGPLGDELRRAVHDAQLDSRCVFIEPTFEFDELEAIYSTAIAALSPGYLGLSLVQAMSFGVPMLAADLAPHAPERALASVDGSTRFFARGSASSLAAALEDAAEQPISDGRRAAMRRHVHDHHSIDSMVEALVESVR